MDQCSSGKFSGGESIGIRLGKEKVLGQKLSVYFLACMCYCERLACIPLQEKADLGQRKARRLNWFCV